MRKRNSQPKALNDAKKLYKLLLWDLTNGNLGTKPDIPFSDTDNKGGKLLDNITKIAVMEAKYNEDQPEQSGLDLIRKNLYGDRETRGGRNHGGTAESSADNDGDTPEEGVLDTGADGSAV